jgi:hypothetical protein
MMNTATAANEINHAIGNDYSLSDGLDAEYLEVELDEFGHTPEERRARQELNASMFDFYFG